jgi:hypothetical protein
LSIPSQKEEWFLFWHYRLSICAQLWILFRLPKITLKKTVSTQATNFWNKFTPFLQYLKLRQLGQLLKWLESVDKWWEDMVIQLIAKWQLFTEIMMLITLGKVKIIYWFSKPQSMSFKITKKLWQANKSNLLFSNFYKM